MHLLEREQNKWVLDSRCLTKVSFQLDFTFQNGVEAVRILLLEGFNKSASFVNTAKSLEQHSQ